LQSIRIILSIFGHYVHHSLIQKRLGSLECLCSDLISEESLVCSTTSSTELQSLWSNQIIMNERKEKKTHAVIHPKAWAVYCIGEGITVRGCSTWNKAEQIWLSTRHCKTTEPTVSTLFPTVLRSAKVIQTVRGAMNEHWANSGSKLAAFPNCWFPPFSVRVTLYEAKRERHAMRTTLE